MGSMVASERSSVRIASALSTEADTASAVRAAAERVASELGAQPDLVCVFCSPHHRSAVGLIPAALRVRLSPRHLIGCSGEWIVGDGREVDEGPALAVWAAKLDRAGLESFHARFVRTPEGAAFVGFPDLGEIVDARAVILLADPFSFPADALLRLAPERFGDVPFIGGVASGGMGPGTNVLVHDQEVHDSGAVGVVLSGDVALRAIVSQGCRPIGESYVVTKAEGNVIKELAGRPPLERLQQTVAKLAPSERVLASEGLHVGLVIDEQKEWFGRGDFLIRAVVGGEPDEGWIAVGDEVEVGRTVQFHVRDAETADEDLRELLLTVGPAPAGALLFTCNGRGSRMFSVPDHDVHAIRQVLGEIPVAGFFCQGEIGPVGPRSFLHGFTASAAFFG